MKLNLKPENMFLVLALMSIGQKMVNLRSTEELTAYWQVLMLQPSHRI